MKAYVVHTRPLPGSCKGAESISIIEVEGEKISSLEDPSVMWLKDGEFYFRILKPEVLYEPKESKIPDGSKKKVMVPPVYFSAAIYATVELAQVAAKQMIKGGLDFEVRKGRLASYSEEDLKAKCAEIQEIML